jgi:hypothetical protein
MDKGIYWEVFEKTGLIEAFLAYCSAEASSSDSSLKLENISEKSVEREK